MEKKAQARVAYDVASTEQTIDKPDSVLFMSCFNNSAGNSALNIGSIFSGDYTAGINNIVPDALTAFSNDFAEADGNDTGVVDYTQTALGTNITACDETKELWDQVSNEGIQKNIPFPLYSDFKTGANPTGAATVLAGSNFDDDWQQSNTDGVFSDLQNATNPGVLPTVTIPAYTATTTACSVVIAAGIAGSCPP